LGRGPLVTDCDVKQLKWFEAYHGREEQFTNQSKTLIKIVCQDLQYKYR
jgi:hypothetical protein